MKQNLIVTKYNFTNAKIAHDLRIVMLADLHNQTYGPENDRLLLAIAKEKPDMILLPGDMIVCHTGEEDGNSETAQTIRCMTEIAPVYYSYGNHERGLLESVHGTDGLFEKYRKELSHVKHLSILKNEHIALPDFHVCIYGLDLPRAYYTRIFKKTLHTNVLETYIGKPDLTWCNLVLAHNPDYFRVYCTLQPDFIFSGHNHGGMVRIPGVGGLVSPRLHPFPKYDYGIYKGNQEKTTMIVTSGCGMHSIPIRINNPPELVAINVNKV